MYIVLGYDKTHPLHIMYYEINISKVEGHLFATAPRSITDSKTCKTMLKLFIDKFPESEGYKISLSVHADTGGHLVITGNNKTSDQCVDIINPYNR